VPFVIRFVPFVLNGFDRSFFAVRQFELLCAWKIYGKKTSFPPNFFQQNNLVANKLPTNAKTSLLIVFQLFLIIYRQNSGALTRGCNPLLSFVFLLVYLLCSATFFLVFNEVGELYDIPLHEVVLSRKLGGNELKQCPPV
jgi:hypothetical protein